jgi:hypothetical protein
LGEIFEGYYADTCAEKISTDVDGGLSGVSRCADTGARTPIGVSGNFSRHFLKTCKRLIYIKSLACLYVYLYVYLYVSLDFENEDD